MMKKLGALLLLMSVTMVSVGCPKEDKKPTTPAPADKPADKPADGDATPAPMGDNHKDEDHNK